MRPVSLLLLLLFLLAPLSVFAYADQPLLIPLPLPQHTYARPKQLTLRDAILLALRTNPSVRNGEIQRIADKFALEVAHNAFWPQYTFNANTTLEQGSKPQYSASPQATLLTPLGTQVQLNYNQNYLGTAGNGSTIQGVITQPLLRGFGPKITMAPLQTAEYQEDNARLTLKNTIMTTITSVIQNYYALVQAYQSLFVDELALEDSMTILAQYRIRIQAGQAAPLEIAPQQSQVANQELQITQDRNAIQQAYQTLLTTLGLDPRSKLQIVKTIDVDTLKIPSVKQAYNLALQNNIPYQQALYTLKNDELQTMVQRDQQRWLLDVVATKTISPGSGSSSPAVTTIVNTPGGLSTNTGGLLTPIFGGGAASVTTPDAGDTIAFNLSIPIDNKTLQQGLVNAQVALEQERITVAELRRALLATIITTIRSLQLQQQQIIQAEQAVAYAQQAYDVEKVKLRYGRSTVLNVTQLQTTLTQTEQALISQKINYINALAQFEESLGITLDRWSIQVYY